MTNTRRKKPTTFPVTHLNELDLHALQEAARVTEVIQFIMDVPVEDDHEADKRAYQVYEESKIAIRWLELA
jgi:hypothetical protein